jgi:hypothetical protein
MVGAAQSLAAAVASLAASVAARHPSRAASDAASPATRAVAPTNAPTAAAPAPTPATMLEGDDDERANVLRERAQSPPVGRGVVEEVLPQPEVEKLVRRDRPRGLVRGLHGRGKCRRARHPR